MYLVNIMTVDEGEGIIMGTRVKNTSNKINNKLFKKVAELSDRLDAMEQAVFHGILRSESMINVLINSGIISKEVLNKEIDKLFQESQKELMNNQDVSVT